MGLGSLAFSAFYSLKTVDDWIATINANTNGAGKVGFRSSKFKFGGDSVTSITAGPSPRLGIRVGEQSLTAAQTAVVFKPGTLVGSDEPTHFGIKDNQYHFFVVDQRIDHSTTITGVAQDVNTHLLTRDGEFHWGDVESDGFYYLRDSNGNYVVNLSPAAFYNNGALSSELVRTNDPLLLDQTLTTNELTPGIIQALEPALLEFSDTDGSTYFKWPGNNKVKGDPLDPTQDLIDGRATGMIQNYAVEGSNSSLTETVPELALAQKVYSAIASVIKVANANLDEVLRLIR